MGLSGRVALVTGGGRGIGRAISLALAREGADVAINFRRDEEAARAVADEIQSLGRKAGVYQASVDRFEECEALVQRVIGDFGFVDILINNAGLASRGRSVAETDPAELARVLATHAFGPHYLSKLVLPGMRSRPRGDIVMISSAATRFMPPYSAPYNMGKAALEALAATLAKEELRHGIHVNVVAPGLVETEMGRRLVKATQNVDDMRKLDAASPFGHVCTPEEVAAVVCFFVSEGAAYVSGQRLYVDGGGA